MGFLVLDTRGAGAALPQKEIVADMISGDAIELQSTRFVNAAGKQRPILRFEARQAEDLAAKKVIQSVAAIATPLEYSRGTAAWILDADGATPFVAPADGTLSIYAWSVGLWEYAFNHQPSADRAFIGGAATRDARRNGRQTGDGSYPLTIVSAEGQTYDARQWPHGATHATVRTTAVAPTTIRRTYSAADVHDEDVTSGQLWELGNCDQFEVRAGGGDPVDLIFRVRLR